MAVTGTETVRDLIEDALLDIEAHTMGQAMDATQADHGRRALQRMLKAWQVEHGTPYHLVAQQTVTATTSAAHTLSPVRPIRILSARVIPTSGNEIPMVELTRDEYDTLPNKTATGIPTQFYYDKQKESAVFYVWPLFSAVTTETFKVTYERETEDIADLTDVIDIPAEWYDAAVKNLASRLRHAYGKGQRKQDIVIEAKLALDAALGAGVDGQSVYWGME